MIRLLNLRKGKGFTLLEACLGLAIGALLLASMTIIFKVSKQSWNVSNQQGELLQHARMAMSRLSSELRYATGLTIAGPTVIEFPTNVLINTDNSTTEKIRYDIIGGTLQRSVDGGPKQIVAGDTASGISVIFSSVIPMKLDVANNVIPLSGLDPLSIAIALQLEITVQDNNAKKVVLRTLVNFRDK